MNARERFDHIRIIPSAPEYAEQMEDLMHAAYGTTRENPHQVFTAAMFRHHMAVFPQGQFIALDGDRVVGLTVSARTCYDPAHPPAESWWQSAGEGWLRHEPDGEWLHGVESVVHPDYRSHGVGGALMAARFAVAQELNLRGMVAGSAIVDYAQVDESVSVEDYVRGVVSGAYFDTNLSKQIRKGFRPLTPIPGFLDDDEGSRGYGVLIVWENPLWQPATPPLAA
jgi:GNAT superfamily N-acetyltransferase